MSHKIKVICIGAGPAGLTAAQVLLENQIPTLVLESDPSEIGGISRTVRRDGFLIDIGGHRFFTKSKRVFDFWMKTLGKCFLQRPRSSKIYYKNKFYNYPLSPIQALRQLGLLESFRCLFSLLLWKLVPKKNPRSFADWTKNQFGQRFFEIFFKTYTEKVWGMSCDEISADWAAQRIRGVSPISALFSKLLRFRNSQEKIKSLIESFHYPKFGPGMMWEKVSENIRALNGEVKLDSKVFKIEFLSEQQEFQVHYEASSGEKNCISCEHLISSMPIQQLLQSLEVPEKIREFGNRLRYRDFLIVALVLEEKELFADNWIYIHDPNVKVGRIQNFRAASPFMVPDQRFYCYGMEYFCNEDSALWNKSDDELIDLAKSELEFLGFSEKSSIKKGFVVRQKKAYPVYDQEYEQNVTAISTYLSECFPNLHLVGRNGMHKYNNQDHSMMTAMLTAENILLGRTKYNVWNVNQDAEYLEIDLENINRNLETGIHPVPSYLSSNPSITK